MLGKSFFLCEIFYDQCMGTLSRNCFEWRHCPRKFAVLISRPHALSSFHKNRSTYDENQFLPTNFIFQTPGNNSLFLERRFMHFWHFCNSSCCVDPCISQMNITWYTKTKIWIGYRVIDCLQMITPTTTKRTKNNPTKKLHLIFDGSVPHTDSELRIFWADVSSVGVGNRQCHCISSIQPLESLSYVHRFMNKTIVQAQQWTDWVNTTRLLRLLYGSLFLLELQLRSLPKQGCPSDESLISHECEVCFRRQ